MPASPVLMQGNEAVAEGAIAAGARFFAGYPEAIEKARESGIDLPMAGA